MVVELLVPVFVDLRQEGARITLQLPIDFLLAIDEVSTKSIKSLLRVVSIDELHQQVPDLVGDLDVHQNEAFQAAVARYLWRSKV